MGTYNLTSIVSMIQCCVAGCGSSYTGMQGEAPPTALCVCNNCHVFNSDTIHVHVYTCTVDMSREVSLVPRLSSIAIILSLNSLAMNIQKLKLLQGGEPGNEAR